MEYKLKYVEFKKEFATEIEANSSGIYQIIALPFSERNSDSNAAIVDDYVDFCQNFYLHSWEEKVTSTTQFSNRSLHIDLNDINAVNIDKSREYIENEGKDDLHKFFMDFLPFLPSLYIGIAKDLKTRFAQHTNINNTGSTIYKLTNNREYAMFKNCKKYFIWKEIVEKDLSSFNVEYRDVLEEFERVMIQTKKPLINKVKRK